VSARLEGKRCLVTGGGSGVGRAVARRYADEGALVVVSGRRSERLEETGAGLDTITTCPGDVCAEADVQRMVEPVVERHGGLDVVFHAAGVLRRNEKLEETDLATWEQDVAINLTGAYLVCACRSRISESRAGRSSLWRASWRTSPPAGIRPTPRRSTAYSGSAVFLASEHSAWMTGQSLVDGGFTTQ
jgi:NAD(P)-dependent dehydrogenase (short-subunit alcohol dehydrogenase family)